MTSPPPLRLDQLSLRGFRNLASLDLAPGPRFNVLFGDNGQGKSNLLEAIHYLGALDSFRLARRDALIQHDTGRAVIAGKFASQPAPITAKIGLDRTRPRVLSLNGKRPRSKAAWIASIQMVLFHPGDLALASGGPQGRRDFVDRLLEKMDGGYSKTRAAYTKALRSRNRLLKHDQTDRRSITSYDTLLAEHGAVIGAARAALVDQLGPLTSSMFAKIAGDDLPLAVTYRPRVAPERPLMLAALERSLGKDLARGFTAEGPHADDIALTVRSRGARHHASQGQHRMMVLALKIAELQVITDRVGRVPILLLDDVSSELDSRRNARLMSLLHGLGGQVFVTTTHRALIRIDGGADRVDCQLCDGRVVPAGTTDLERD